MNSFWLFNPSLQVPSQALEEECCLLDGDGNKQLVEYIVSSGKMLQKPNGEKLPCKEMLEGLPVNTCFLPNSAWSRAKLSVP